jgi:hypothetical protein
LVLRAVCLHFRQTDGGLEGSDAPSRRAAAHFQNHRLRRHQEHRGGAFDARQHPAHQSLLGDDDADDLDGTIVEERIYHDAGATTEQGLRRAELLQLIRKAGRTPVERDTLYRPVERSEATFTVLV